VGEVSSVWIVGIERFVSKGVGLQWQPVQQVGGDFEHHHLPRLPVHVETEGPIGDAELTVIGHNLWRLRSSHHIKQVALAFDARTNMDR